MLCYVVYTQLGEGEVCVFRRVSMVAHLRSDTHTYTHLHSQNKSSIVEHTHSPHLIFFPLTLSTFLVRS